MYKLRHSSLYKLRVSSFDFHILDIILFNQNTWRICTENYVYIKYSIIIKLYLMMHNFHWLPIWYFGKTIQVRYTIHDQVLKWGVLLVGQPSGWTPTRNCISDNNMNPYPTRFKSRLYVRDPGCQNILCKFC